MNGWAAISVLLVVGSLAVGHAGAGPVSNCSLSSKAPKADPRLQDHGKHRAGALSFVVSLQMPRKGKNQLTVELAPNVKAYLLDLAASGEILSPQEFIRRAIDDAILARATSDAARRRKAAEGVREGSAGARSGSP